MITSPGTSAMIVASHSTVVPAGPFATQCERPSPRSLNRLEMFHEARQVLEVAPETVNLFRRTIDDATRFRVNAVAAIAGELLGADQIERRNCEHVGCRERNASAFRVRRSQRSAETREIHRVARNA